MQFDDRLATVLRMQADHPRAAATQFRQLLDLVGSAPAGAGDRLLDQAFARLGELSRRIPADQQAKLIGEPELRLRNPELIAFLAGIGPPVAAAALSSARLDEEQWNALVPTLPAAVRPLLRMRRDLPETTLGLLAALDVRDPGSPGPVPEDVLELDPALELMEDEAAGIHALVRRIEAFRKAREAADAAAQDAPFLPLDELPRQTGPAPRAFDFSTDAEGRIDWADPALLAPMAIGMALASGHAQAPARASQEVLQAMRQRLPIRAGRVFLSGAPAIEGEWRIDAIPHFSAPGGCFAGYRGRMRRPCPPAETGTGLRPDDFSDRIRQMLHELHTPVNAIQGFAEMIQQQVIGPVPNEYRALAAAIAGDAARLLAGFEELDRMAQLESGALRLQPGTSDLRAIVIGTVRQLDAALRSRSAGLEPEAPPSPCPAPLTRHDAQLLLWRLLATTAAAASPGEALRVTMAVEGSLIRLRIDLPASLAGRDDIFAAFAPARPQAVMPGMFGAGFTLRLARAEARAAGGELAREDDRLVLTLPCATAGETVGGVVKAMD